MWIYLGKYLFLSSAFFNKNKLLNKIVNETRYGATISDTPKNIGIKVKIITKPKITEIYVSYFSNSGLKYIEVIQINKPAKNNICSGKYIKIDFMGTVLVSTIRYGKENSKLITKNLIRFINGLKLFKNLNQIIYKLAIQ